MTEKEFADSIDKMEKKHSNYLKLAFLAAILQLRNNIDNEELDVAIANSSIDGIFRVIDPEQLDSLLHGIGMDKKNLIFSDEAMSVFHIAAAAMFLQLPLNIQQKWHYNPIAERVISTLLSDTSRIALELTESLKTSVSTLLNPTSVSASDLSARVRDIKQTLGLTQPQAQAVLNFRNQLETQKLLGFTAPQNRLMSETDRLLLRDHMKNGTLTQKGIDRMVKRYYESLLNQRASDIATATVMNGINSGMNELLNQGLQQSIFDSRDRKFWNTMLDKKVRPTHRAIPGMNPNGVQINSMFVTPTGNVPYPLWGMGDYVHCRCFISYGRI